MQIYKLLKKKLPYKICDHWRIVVCDIQKVGHRAIFSDIVEFIERQVKIVSDPLFGSIQDDAAMKKKLR